MKKYVLSYPTGFYNYDKVTIFSWFVAFCPQCGKLVTKDENYCSYCGQELFFEKHDELQKHCSVYDMINKCFVPIKEEMLQNKESRYYNSGAKNIDFMSGFIKIKEVE